VTSLPFSVESRRVYARVYAGTTLACLRTGIHLPTHWRRRCSPDPEAVNGEMSSAEAETWCVLTGIPLPLQCPAASVEAESPGQADEAAVQAFIETLARIAHPVAARKAHKQQEKAEE
jgi:hypothetical protein